MQPIILVAEILWDEYEDGSMLLGGSGLNIAWHLQGLGCSSCVVSSIGRDSAGENFSLTAKKWGISLDYIQQDPEHPTGIVKVILDRDKKPTFISQEEMSMDHIHFKEELKNFPKDSFVYHGTFMLRNPDTRRTIQKLRELSHPVFMDLNLRDPFWSHELLDQWVKDLKFLKLSDDEFIHLSEQKNLPPEAQLDWLKNLSKKKRIENVLFTLGSNGSYWIHGDEVFHTKATVVDAIDTVGAGDAFVAAILFSLEMKLSEQEALEKASQFAARICTIHGATSHDKEFYKKCRKEIWDS